MTVRTDRRDAILRAHVYVGAIDGLSRDVAFWAEVERLEQPVNDNALSAGIDLPDADREHISYHEFVNASLSFSTWATVPVWLRMASTRRAS